MEDAIADGIRDGGVGEEVVPPLVFELTRDDRGTKAVAVFEDLEEAATRRWVKSVPRWQTRPKLVKLFTEGFSFARALCNCSTKTSKPAFASSNTESRRSTTPSGYATSGVRCTRTH